MTILVVAKRLTLAFGAVMFGASAAEAAPIDLTGRSTPLHIQAPGDLDRVQARLDNNAPAVHLTAPFALSAEDARRNHALFVPLTQDASVKVNGKHVELDPIVRHDGMVFSVPASLLQEGSNEVEVRRHPRKSTAASWAGTTLFSVQEIEEIHFGAAFADAAFIPKDSEPPTADQQKYDALSYDLLIEPDFQAAMDNAAPNTVQRALASKITSASLTMVGKNISGAPLSLVVVDFDRNSDKNSGQSPLSPTGLDISYVDSGPGTSEITALSHNDTTNKLSVTLPAAIAAGGEFTLRFFYSGYPNVVYTTPGGYNQIAQAFVGSTHNSGKPVIYTANQPFGARRWFPCKDVPADKASSSTMRIVIPFKDTSPADGENDYGTMSNGITTSVTYDPTDVSSETGITGTETHVWENNAGIPTYLMAIYASNYQFSEGESYTFDDNSTMPILHAIYPENAAYEGAAAAGTRDIIGVYSSLFGEYPFKSQKYGTASWNITFGIENQTATGMPSGLSGNTLGNGYTDRNIHEIAHQWWGDNVTYSDFDHVWLGEGFATYSEALWREFKSGGSFADYTTRMTFYYNSAATVSSLSTPLVSTSGESILGTNIFYRRGAWVVHMLRHVLGDDVFFEMCQTYQSTLAQSSIDSAGLQTVAETVSGKDLDAFFTQWLYRTNQASAPTMPKYKYSATLGENGGNYKLDVTIEQTQGGTAGNAFVMPIDLWVSDGVTETSFTVQNTDYTQSYELQLGTTIPLLLELDPDMWIFRKKDQLNIQTVGLPQATAGQAYSHTLSALDSSGSYTWSGTTGQSGLSISTGGVLSGTVTSVPGVYPINLSVTTSNGTRTATLRLVVNGSATAGSVVINEVYYDNRLSATDAGEFIELKNTTASPINIGSWQVILVDGATGTTYAPSPITIPGGTVIAANGYYLIGNVAGADLATSLDNQLQNGNPDAIILRNSSATRIDSLNYEGDSAFGGSGTNRTEAIAEGATGRVVSTAFGDADNASLGRLPDGQDTGSNLLDFACMIPSPGAANTNSVTLPFSDNFDGVSGADSAWRTGFTSVRCVAYDGTLPTTSPQGGNYLEVIDRTGGGDVTYLPGAFSRINFEGYLWIPATVAVSGWSTGVGVATRNESAWFSSTNGNGMESGFYLEYQNGPTTTMKGGAFPSASGAIRLMAVDSFPSFLSGAASAAVTELGRVAYDPGASGAWLRFRLAYDGDNGKIAAYIGGSSTPFALEDVPIGNYPTSGGVVIGFREDHTGLPAANEGTWVDDISVTTVIGPDVPVGLGFFELE